MSEVEKGQGGQQQTFTQDEVNSIIQSRLAEEKKKFSDYEALKEKAAKFDQQEEANKSELQKANERAESLQKQIDAMNEAKTLEGIKSKISAETGVPAELLHGMDEETCKAQAKALMEWAKPGKSYPGTKKNSVNKKADSSSGERDSWAEFANQLFDGKE